MDAQAVDLCFRRRSRSWPDCGRASRKFGIRKEYVPSTLLHVIDEGDTIFLPPEDLQSCDESRSSPPGICNSSRGSGEEFSEQPSCTRTKLHQHIHVLCKSQGHFMNGIKGGPVYEGGQTRLLCIPACSNMDSLKRALAKAATKDIHDDYSEMIIKCCLPSIPDKLVDVIEDDDVNLLLQEWKESCSSELCPAGKLIFFVSWKGTSGDLE